MLFEERWSVSGLPLNLRVVAQAHSTPLMRTRKSVIALLVCETFQYTIEIGTVEAGRPKRRLWRGG